mmetsp:Transcript_2818/g.11510  ORF Transcript_2818/g.11510 Transcript_2818/m.11510 type:complete len:209 (-) Transcript_2818:93-719(-)
MQLFLSPSRHRISLATTGAIRIRKKILLCVVHEANGLDLAVKLQTLTVRLDGVEKVVIVESHSDPVAVADERHGNSSRAVQAGPEKVVSRKICGAEQVVQVRDGALQIVGVAFRTLRIDRRHVEAKPEVKRLFGPSLPTPRAACVSIAPLSSLPIRGAFHLYGNVQLLPFGLSLASSAAFRRFGLVERLLRAEARAGFHVLARSRTRS